MKKVILISMHTMKKLDILTLIFLFVLLSSLLATHETLQVISFPSRAEIIVDGISTGKVTPVRIAMPEAIHEVTVQVPVN